MASRAGASLKARAECGLGHLRLATDGPGPGERQERRRHELESRSIRIFAERVSDTQVLSRQKRQRPEPLFARHECRDPVVHTPILRVCEQSERYEVRIARASLRVRRELLDVFGKAICEHNPYVKDFMTVRVDLRRAEHENRR